MNPVSSSRSMRGQPLRDRIMREAGCEHSRQPGEPMGYLAWFEWVETYAETHDQGQCPRCRLWVIWTPKERS